MANSEEGDEVGSVTVNYAFHLDLRFLSAALNRQVKVIGFRDFGLLPNVQSDDIPNSANRG